MPCLRRCPTISTTSPNQEGVEGTDSAEVWICTDPSAILVICASLREWKWFFSLKEAHFYPCLLQLNSSLRIAWALQGIAEKRRRQAVVTEKLHHADLRLA